MNRLDTKECFSSHMGNWLIEPVWINRALTAIKNGVMAESKAITLEEAPAMIVQNGIANIQIVGTMMKGFSKFGGTSTVLVRQQIREAVASQEVSHILLSIDSPGGHVAGTKELADEVRRASLIKPVIAQIEDLGASASLWVASQASRVYANATAEVGSIGVVAVLHDTSEAYEREGVKVHIVSTGKLKGAMTDGTPISEDMIKSVQSKVDALNKFFVEAVADGRGMSADSIYEIATGETYMSNVAYQLGLIDGVQSMEETISQITKDIQGNRASLRTARARAEYYKVKSQSRIQEIKQSITTRN
jgi:signal peptide peptidase SppA